ncbi:hypothetical protein C8J56DRAFT_768677 [Mycena floridula]|nr:hypothetical protein C8J56DRAFT_768677 [Mycena floridula]
MDPNSVETFKQNIQLLQEQVKSLQAAARDALNGIRNAYHPGSNPAQTEAYLATLRQAAQMIAELMRNSGVGSLPLTPESDEQKLFSETTRSVQSLFEVLKRSQESSGVVANLLATKQ